MLAEKSDKLTEEYGEMRSRVRYFSEGLAFPSHNNLSVSSATGLEGCRAPPVFIAAPTNALSHRQMLSDINFSCPVWALGA